MTVSRETPPVPPEAAALFGDRLGLVVAYADLLADAGTVRGLIGPREVPRLWDRHLLGCAVLADLVPVDATVADLGSGAGLPGLVLALRRPDLTVTLVEPLLRRTTFLDEAVAGLGLTNVEVVRARAEQLHGVRTFTVVTSRAVARLDTLLTWSLPLVGTGGCVLAMKGRTAADEVEETRPVWTRWGLLQEPHVVEVGAGEIPEPTTAVRVEPAPGTRLRSPGRGAARSGRAPRR